MGFYSDYLVPLLAGIFLFGVTAWIIFSIYWGMKQIGLTVQLRYIYLKIKFRKYVYDDNVISFCRQVILRGWTYKELVVIAKSTKRKEEIIYTYLLLKKMKGGIVELSREEKRKLQSKNLEEFVESIPK